MSVIENRDFLLTFSPVCGILNLEFDNQSQFGNEEKTCHSLFVVTCRADTTVI